MNKQEQAVQAHISEAHRLETLAAAVDANAPGHPQSVSLRRQAAAHRLLADKKRRFLVRTY
jgi:hypothetical protein